MTTNNKKPMTQAERQAFLAQTFTLREVFRILWDAKPATYKNLTTGRFEDDGQQTIDDLEDKFRQEAEVKLAAKPAFPERDASKPAEQQGIFHKFDVRRVDGSDQPGGKHHGCRYFVLDMDHDAHAPAALRTYAESCADTHPQLAIALLTAQPQGDN